MFKEIAMAGKGTKKYFLVIVSVFAVLSLANSRLNSVNRFAYSKRKVLFAT